MAGETIERAKVSRINAAVSGRDRLEKIRAPLRALRMDGNHLITVLDAAGAAALIAGPSTTAARIANTLIAMLMDEETATIRALEALGYEVDVE